MLGMVRCPPVASICYSLGYNLTCRVTVRSNQNGAARELEGLPAAFAGLLPYCALSGLLVERKSQFQSDQPQNGQPIETAERRFRNWRGRLPRRDGARL